MDDQEHYKLNQDLSNTPRSAGLHQVRVGHNKYR